MIRVINVPPMKPSHVFLGDNLMSGVRPHRKPKKYAHISFEIINRAGKRNLHTYIHHTSYIIHHTSYIIHRALYIIYHTSYIIHHTSYIIHHTSYIIHHTSYIIHHTSYIIHHTHTHTHTI